MDQFTNYLDPKTLDFAITFFNSLNYFLNIYLLTLIGYVGLGLFGYKNQNIIPSPFESIKYKDNILFSSYGVLIIPSIALLINNKLNIYLNFYGFVLLAIILNLFVFFSISKKSLKWISISLLSFLTFALFLYVLSIELVVNQNISLLQYFQLDNYTITYKSFFSIYEKGDTLIKVTYPYGDSAVNITNNAIFKRLYLHLYVLNSFVTAFWLAVYWFVLKVHNIRLTGNI